MFWIIDFWCFFWPFYRYLVVFSLYLSIIKKKYWKLLNTQRKKKVFLILIVDKDSGGRGVTKIRLVDGGWWMVDGAGGGCKMLIHKNWISLRLFICWNPSPKMLWFISTNWCFQLFWLLFWLLGGFTHPDLYT